MFGCAVELIEDDAVIDALYERLFSCCGMQVEELFSFLYEFTQANGYDAQVILGAIKVDAGLLFVWFYFEQDDLFRCINAEDRLAQQGEIAVLVEAAEELAIVIGYRKMPAQGLGVIGPGNRRGLRSPAFL